MKLIAKVNNLPNEVDEKYVVARIDGIELWFWGSYETRRRAEEVAYELGRAIVLEAESEGVC